MRRTPRRLIGTLIAAVALLVVVAGLGPGDHPERLSWRSQPSIQAGAHSDFHLHMDFGTVR